MGITRTETVPEWGRYDVIVAGGGVSGVAAALAAARHGQRVLLLEKSVKLGGLATLGLINFFVAMCDGYGRQICFGMADEFLKLSQRHGYGKIPPEFVNGRIPPETIEQYKKAGKPLPRLKTRMSADIFALELLELCIREGVEISFDTLVTKPVMDERNEKKLAGLIVENKSGAGYYAAEQFVDTTGDADLLARAGVPTLKRGNYHTYIAYTASLESCKKAEESGYIRNMFGKIGPNATLYGGGQPETLPLYDGTDAKEVNRYLQTCQLAVLEEIKKLPDRNTRDIIALPGMPQFRTTRCIEGDHVLRETDVLRHFDDSVCLINDFDRRGYLFEVPFGTLVRRGWDNLITAGRSASAEGYAWDALRVIPPAILTGQAAGTAAAHAVREGKPVTEIDLAKLQADMEQQNVAVHYDDKNVPEDLSGVFEGSDN